MRAKILFLTENQEERKRFRPMQQILSAVAVSFGHSFVMRETSDEGELREDTLFKIRDSHSLVLFGSPTFIESINQFVGVFTGIRQHILMEGMQAFSRLKTGNMMQANLIWPVRVSSSCLQKTSLTACTIAKRTETKLLFILPKQKDFDWQEILIQNAKSIDVQAPLNTSIIDVIPIIDMKNSQIPTILATNQDVMILDSFIRYVNGTESMGFSSYCSDQQHIYVPDNQSGLLSLLMMTIELLRESLNLRREADCLQTAVNNALSNIERPSQLMMDEQYMEFEEEMLHLVEEQVALVGELFERQGKY